MDANAGEGWRLPWSGKEEEEVPIGGECDDCDCPFVIRDADNKIVLTIWEHYSGHQGMSHHVSVGMKILNAINAANQ